MTDFIFQPVDRDGIRWMIMGNTEEARRVIRTLTHFVSMSKAGTMFDVDRAGAKKLKTALRSATYDVVVEGGTL